MRFTVEEFNRAKNQMLSDFNKAIAAADELRKAEAEFSDEELAAALATVEKEQGGDGASSPGETRTTVVAVAGR